MTKDNKWARLLTYITGMVNQRLLLQCECLAAEYRILRSQLPTRIRLSVEQRSTLAEIGRRLGRKYLAEVACVAKPATILAWYRRLIAQKFDGRTVQVTETSMPLGSRNLGEVWKARDTRPGRSVALKLIKTQLNERFDRDARAMAAGNTVIRAK